ncbi:MAG: c-type cytochrome [Sandaracinus sp.]
MKLLRVVGILVLSVTVAALITLGAMVQTSRSSLARAYEAHGAELAIPDDEASLAEGHRLYRAYGCVSCHLEDGGGRIVIAEGPGFIAAPDLSTAMRNWTPAELDGLVRWGVRPDGSPVLLMPAHDYWYLDDASVAAILGYARTLPPTGRGYPPSELTMLGHVLHALDAFPLVPAEHVGPVGRRPPMGEPGTVERGRTLGRMCTGCHGEHLSGGVIPGTDPAQLGTPPNLTNDPSGLSAWTEEQFRTALRTGVTPAGTTLNATWMPWQDCYQYFTDDEIHSLWLWLRELPPQPAGNR